MRFPGNCLVVAAVAAVLGGGRVCTKRNRAGRLHFFWQDREGRGFHFHAPGRSRRSYLGNALYLGCVARAPHLDRVAA